MTVAAFVLGVVATVLAAASLTWQLAAFRLRGAQPKLTPVVGLLTPHGLVTNDAGSNQSDALARAADQLQPGRFVLGVKVVNTGRAPFHVDEWAIRAEKDGTSLGPGEAPDGGARVPHDIPPGASAIFITDMQHAQRFADVTKGLAGLPIVLTVSSGARTYVTKPVAPELFSLGKS
ncbi:hypothetical protein [Mycobacterium riyadhense]|uniref:Uncharacterized protein n=1 Tax=Mycobacterium riyadhense TaxID=486698 RepID=A0A653EJW3_9MYCO|nr:hypothetical protein [Mycobacterium riyadhense]VTO97756.1 hypothetical protein BIN_B_02246 [Mycobacterium riyadhense]